MQSTQLFKTMTRTMTKSSAAKLPPPFDATHHKPLEQMVYQDRMAVWQEYCTFRRLSHEFPIFSNPETLAYVEKQAATIKAAYLDKFSSTDLIDPQYL